VRKFWELLREHRGKLAGEENQVLDGFFAGETTRIDDEE
jgi:hypothetical protein